MANSFFIKAKRRELTKMLQKLSMLRSDCDRIARIMREGGWVALGQLISVVAAVVLVRMLTELLEPHQYGELVLVLTVSGLINQVVSGGVTNSVGRFYSIACEAGDLQGFLRASFRMLGVSSVLTVLLAMLVAGVLVIQGHSRWLWPVVGVGVFALFCGLNSALSALQNAARQRAVVAWHSGMEGWLKIALAATAVLWVGAGSGSVILGFVLAAGLVCCSQFYFFYGLLRRRGVVLKGSNGGSDDWVAPMWQFAWPFSVFGIFTWAQQVSDRWALETFGATQDVGQFAVVYQLGYTPIATLTGMVMTLVAPVLYQRSGGAADIVRNRSVHTLAWRVTAVSVAVTLLGFASSWLFHDWLFQWLVAPAYRAASIYFPWVVLAGGVFAAGQMLSLKLMSELKSSRLIGVKIVSALVGCAANVVGAIYWGTSGVVGGLVVFSIVYFVWTFIICWNVSADGL